MTKLQHSIQKNIYEIAFSNEAKALQLQQRIQVLIKDYLVKATDEVFDEIDQSDIIIKTDQLVIDIGEVSWDNLEEETILKFKDILRRKLKDHILQIKLGSQDGNKVQSPPQAGIDLVIYFFRTGYTPWWAISTWTSISKQSAANFSIEKLFSILLKEDAPKVLNKIRPHFSERDFQIRFIRQLSDEFLIEFAQYIFGEGRSDIKKGSKSLLSLVQKMPFTANSSQTREYFWIYLLAELMSTSSAKSAQIWSKSVQNTLEQIRQLSQTEEHIFWPFIQELTLSKASIQISSSTSADIQISSSTNAEKFGRDIQALSQIIREDKNLAQIIQKFSQQKVQEQAGKFWEKKPSIQEIREQQLIPKLQALFPLYADFIRSYVRILRRELNISHARATWGIIVDYLWSHRFETFEFKDFIKNTFLEIVKRQTSLTYEEAYQKTQKAIPNFKQMIGKEEINYVQQLQAAWLDSKELKVFLKNWLTESSQTKTKEEFIAYLIPHQYPAILLYIKELSSWSFSDENEAWEIALTYLWAHRQESFNLSKFIKNITQQFLKSQDPESKSELISLLASHFPEEFEEEIEDSLKREESFDLAEIFQYFLRHGNLPWTTHIRLLIQANRKKTKQWPLESVFNTLLQKEPKAFKDILSKAQLTQEIAHRLTESFSVSFLKTIVLYLPENARNYFPKSYFEDSLETTSESSKSDLLSTDLKPVKELSYQISIKEIIQQVSLMIHYLEYFLQEQHLPDYVQTSSIKDISPISFILEKFYQLQSKAFKNYLKTLNKSKKESLRQESPVLMDKMLDQIEQELKVSQLKQTLEAEAKIQKLEIQEEIYVRNAGLILLHPFLKRLFTVLELFDKKNFKGQEEAFRAVHLLQFLANKQEQAEEHELVLNKILCGVPLEESIHKDIVLSDKEKDTCESLLQAVTQQWEQLKTSSNDNLRASFLIREGRLLEEEEEWKLTIEQKGYDVLLDFLPWGYKMVMLSWMKKGLNVEW